MTTIVPTSTLPLATGVSNSQLITTHLLTYSTLSDVLLSLEKLKYASKLTFNYKILMCGNNSQSHGNVNDGTMLSARDHLFEPSTCE